jgi:hypothetical protein
MSETKNDGTLSKIAEKERKKNLNNSSVHDDKLLMKMPEPYQPKLNNRWLVKFPEPFNIPQWCFSKASRPSLDVKKGKWKNMTFLFRDPIFNSIPKIIMNGLGGLTNTNTKLLGITIEMLDPTGVVVEKWVVDGKIINVDFGNLDYSEGKLCEIGMEIKVLAVDLVF